MAALNLKKEPVLIYSLSLHVLFLTTLKDVGNICTDRGKAPCWEGFLKYFRATVLQEHTFFWPRGLKSGIKVLSDAMQAMSPSSTPIRAARPGVVIFFFLCQKWSFDSLVSPLVACVSLGRHKTVLTIQTFKQSREMEDHPPNYCSERSSTLSHMYDVSVKTTCSNPQNVLYFFSQYLMQPKIIQCVKFFPSSISTQPTPRGCGSP